MKPTKNMGYENDEKKSEEGELKEETQKKALKEEAPKEETSKKEASKEKALKEPDGQEESEKKTEKLSLKTFFKYLFTVRDNMMPYYEIEKMMYDNTKISGSNMCILMMAIFIASIGLNTNSTAVIIGAMLISPLMNNIIAFGYSVAVEDLQLLLRSVLGFLTQVIISLITSTLYFMASPLTTTTSELLARTSPTLWDVLIAVCGGLAGMIGTTRRQKSNVIPGVAIATALMPPLCTAGYGLGTGQFRYFFGAFYLFTINVLFIAISSGLITVALGVPHKREKDRKKQKKLHRKVIAIVIITVIPSLIAAAVTVRNAVTEKNISEFVENEVDTENIQVVQTRHDGSEKKITLVLIGEHIEEEEKEILEEKLDHYDLEGYTLSIIQNKEPE